MIQGLKLIKKTGAVDDPDDPSYPFKLEMNCRPPSFMEVAFVGLYGASEVVVVRGMTLEALQKLADVNDLRTHPRLRWLEISGPDGLIEKYEPRPGPR